MDSPHQGGATIREIERKIAECWDRGDSIGETILSVRRRFGVRLTFDDVHHRFVILSAERAA